LAVEAWTISAEGLPTPVSTVGYQSGDVTGNQVLPGQSDVFANQVSIATVNPNQVVTAIGDRSQSMWVTTWGINSGVQAQQLQQIPNTVSTAQGAVAVGAGQITELVPGIGHLLPHNETVQTAFTPFTNSAGEVNVLYWTISSSGQLAQQPALSATYSIDAGVGAAMLPTGVPMTTYNCYGCEVDEYYHGYFANDPWATALSTGENDPPAVVGIPYFLAGPIGSASEGNSPPSAFETYNAYFVTASGVPGINLLYLQVFSYPLPPTSVIL
jgi:hypothetical protein